MSKNRLISDLTTKTLFGQPEIRGTVMELVALATVLLGIGWWFPLPGAVSFSEMMMLKNHCTACFSKGWPVFRRTYTDKHVASCHIRSHCIKMQVMQDCTNRQIGDPTNQPPAGKGSLDPKSKASPFSSEKSLPCWSPAIHQRLKGSCISLTIAIV